jgi:hypothetical protein
MPKQGSSGFQMPYICRNKLLQVSQFVVFVFSNGWTLFMHLRPCECTALQAACRRSCDT